MSPDSRDSNLGPNRFLNFSAPAGNQTQAPGGGPNAEGINMPSAMEALQANNHGLLIRGHRPFTQGNSPVTEISTRELIQGQGHHNLPIALPRE